MKKFLVINILLALAFLSSCRENSTDVQADNLTFDEMKIKSGFTWITERMKAYEPVVSKIDSIKMYYKSDVHGFYVFGKPSCSCEGVHNEIAHFFKILQDASIPIDECDIWAMNSLNNRHPHEETITINNLPAFFLLDNGVPVYSIRDTIIKRKQYAEDKEIKLESILLEALIENTSN